MMLVRRRILASFACLSLVPGCALEHLANGDASTDTHVLDARDVTADAVDTRDAADAMDVTDAVDVPIAMDVTDVIDVPDVRDVIDVPDVPVCPDVDGDGYGALPCGTDCNDNNANIHPGHSDFPDTMGLDENCDGIDGDASTAVFVSTTGSAGGDGSIARPLASIDAGVTLAASMPGRFQVLVAGGTYPETVHLRTNIVVGGGYCGTDYRTRHVDTCATHIAMVPTGVVATDATDSGLVVLKIVL